MTSQFETWLKVEVSETRISEKDNRINNNNNNNNNNKTIVLLKYINDSPAEISNYFRNCKIHRAD